MTEANRQKSAMCLFLGTLVAEALAWRMVESIATRLELSHRFEDNGWDGIVRFRFADGREYTHILPSYELEYTRIPGALIDALHRKLDLLLSREAQP